jgi:hypothetical protein
MNRFALAFTAVSVALNALVLYKVVQHEHGPFEVQCRQSSFQIPIVLRCRYDAEEELYY